MVTAEERDYLWSFYAAERRARINLGSGAASRRCWRTTGARSS